MWEFSTSEICLRQRTRDHKTMFNSDKWWHSRFNFGQLLPDGGPPTTHKHCHSVIWAKNSLWNNGSRNTYTNTCNNTLKPVNDKSSHILVNMSLFTCWPCVFVFLCVCMFCIVCHFGRQLLQEMRLKRNSSWFIVFFPACEFTCPALCFRLPIVSSQQLRVAHGNICKTNQLRAIIWQHSSDILSSVQWRAQLVACSHCWEMKSYGSWW